MKKYLWRLYYMMTGEPKTKRDALYRYARCHGEKIYEIPVSNVNLKDFRGVPVLETSNFNSVLTSAGFPNTVVPTVYRIKNQNVREEVG